MCAIGTGAGGGPIITTALGAITAMDQAIMAMEQAVTAMDQAPPATLKAASSRFAAGRLNPSNRCTGTGHLPKRARHCGSNQKSPPFLLNTSGGAYRRRLN